MVRPQHTLLAECPVCTGGKFTSWAEKNDYAIVRCVQCGFIFVREIPNVEFLKQYYALPLDNVVATYKPKHNLGRALKYRLFAAWIKRYLDQREPIRLLELGCSEGDLLRAVQHNPRFQALGLDYGEATVAYARKLGLNAQQGDVFSMNFGAESFDLVVAIHVIEHVQNLEETLREVHRVLRKGGVFFAVCPCISHIKARLAGNKWKHLGPPGHLWYFSPATFSKLLGRLGFDVLKSSCFYHRAHVRVLARKSAS